MISERLPTGFRRVSKGFPKGIQKDPKGSHKVYKGFPKQLQEVSKSLSDVFNIHQTVSNTNYYCEDGYDYDHDFDDYD